MYEIIKKNYQHMSFIFKIHVITKFKKEYMQVKGNIKKGAS